MGSEHIIEKKLLCDVTGAIRPHVLTALMGVSGAGKTTLLDVLSGRKTIGRIEVDIRVGGHPKDQETFCRVSAYCEQTDLHSSYLIVEESINTLLGCDWGHRLISKIKWYVFCLLL